MWRKVRALDGLDVISIFLRLSGLEVFGDLGGRTSPGCSLEEPPSHQRNDFSAADGVEKEQHCKALALLREICCLIFWI